MLDLRGADFRIDAEHRSTDDRLVERALAVFQPTGRTDLHLDLSVQVLTGPVDCRVQHLPVRVAQHEQVDVADRS